MKHTHVLSFAFSLQALHAYLLLQQDYSQVSQDRHASRVFFFSLLCELAWTCEAKTEIVRFSRAAVNLHMYWGLFIICASRPVCLPIQALLGILIWLTAPSHLSCPCFRQMLLSLCLCLTAEFRLQLQCENLLCLRWCWKFMLWWNPCFGSRSNNNVENSCHY